MPLPTEQQVRLLADMLEAVRDDPTWQPQGGLRLALPCSFSELNAWTSRMPDPGVHRTIEAVLARMSSIGRLNGLGLNPNDLEGLGNLVADDPRLPAFIETLRASWPTPQQVAAITDLYGCVVRTFRQMAAARPNMAPDSPAAKAVDATADALGVQPSEIANRLQPMTDLLASLAAFLPEAPVARRIVQVSSPEINRVFSKSGQMETNDTVSPVSLSGGKSEGFLQSRTGPQGQHGIGGANLFPYFYRMSLSGIAGEVGVHSLELSGDPVALNFSDAGVKADGEVFVITKGGLGTVSPSNVATSMGHLIVTFDPPVRAGEDSYFFGFASRGAPQATPAKIIDTNGKSYNANSMAPSAELMA
jgi:hypothetical protein